MRVWIVGVERNTESVDGEMFWIEGVYADPLEARRACWAEMRNQIEQGQAVYGRRTGSAWEVEVWVREHTVVGTEGSIRVSGNLLATEIVSERRVN